MDIMRNQSAVLITTKNQNIRLTFHMQHVYALHIRRNFDNRPRCPKIINYHPVDGWLIMVCLLSHFFERKMIVDFKKNTSILFARLPTRSNTLLMIEKK